MAVTYKIAKALNGGLWRWTDGETKVFTILGPIRAGRIVDNPRNGIAKAPDILGKTFACTQSAPPANKRYKQMAVNEVELDEAPVKKGKK